MTNKRVLVFAETALALSETFIAAHCRTLQRYDHSLAALYSSGDHHSDIKRHLLFSKRPGAWQRMAFRLGQSRQLDNLIAQTRPDIIHAHYLTNGAFLLPYAKRHHIPLIVTAHGHDATRALRKSSVYDQVYRLQRARLQRSAALVLPVSNFLRDELVAAGFAPERTLTHYLGIALPSAPPVEPANNPPRIVFVGRLVAKKGLDKVLEAFEQVRSVRTDAQLHIVGDGPLRDLVIAKARAIGGIMWHGAQSPDRTQRIMATARVLTLPSRRAPDGDVEGLGLVLLEAQALGIPVVAASTSATAEAVAEGETGFTVDPNNTEQLAASFLKLLSDTELARTMGAKAYHYIRKNFDLAERTQLLEQVYDTVLDQHRAGQAS